MFGSIKRSNKDHKNDEIERVYLKIKNARKVKNGIPDDNRINGDTIEVSYSDEYHFSVVVSKEKPDKSIKVMYAKGAKEMDKSWGVLSEDYRKERFENYVGMPTEENVLAYYKEGLILVEYEKIVNYFKEKVLERSETKEKIKETNLFNQDRIDEEVKDLLSIKKDIKKLLRGIKKGIEKNVKIVQPWGYSKKELNDSMLKLNMKDIPSEYGLDVLKIMLDVLVESGMPFLNVRYSFDTEGISRIVRKNEKFEFREEYAKNPSSTRWAGPPHEIRIKNKESGINRSDTENSAREIKRSKRKRKLELSNEYNKTEKVSVEEALEELDSFRKINF
jgi:hypothetical protein